MSVNINGLEKALARNKARSAALVGSRMLQVGVRAGLRAEVKARRRLSQRKIRDRVSSGRLAASIRSEVSGAPDGFRVDVGTNLKYARVQQEGGTIKPVTAKLLAIPANKQIARSGLWPKDFAPGALRFIPVKDHPRLKGLLVRNVSTSDDTEEKRQSRLGKLRQQSYKDRKRFRKITSSAQASDAQNRARSRRERRKARKGEKGEVLFRLVTEARIPRRPYLLWDADDRAKVGYEMAKIIVNPFDSALGVR